jgi:hypothetical protein
MEFKTNHRDSFLRYAVSWVYTWLAFYTWSSKLTTKTVFYGINFVLHNHPHRCDSIAFYSKNSTYWRSLCCELSSFVACLIHGIRNWTQRKTFIHPAFRQALIRLQSVSPFLGRCHGNNIGNSSFGIPAIGFMVSTFQHAGFVMVVAPTAGRISVASTSRWEFLFRIPEMVCFHGKYIPIRLFWVQADDLSWWLFLHANYIIYSLQTGSL